MKTPNLNKKLVLIVIVSFCAIAIGFGAYFVVQKFVNKKIVEQPAEVQLIDQYRSQLPELKKIAAKSGQSNDLQNYGIAQYATGDTAGAIETYTKQIAKDPNNVIAHSGLANAFRDEKQYDRAIEEYKKAIGISPTNISLYANLGSVYQYTLKQMANAVEVYKQGIEKNPKSIDLYLLLGLAYGQSNDKDRAKQAFEKVLEIDANNLAAKGALERLAQ